MFVKDNGVNNKQQSMFMGHTFEYWLNLETIIQEEKLSEILEENIFLKKTNADLNIRLERVQYKIEAYKEVLKQKSKEEVFKKYESEE